MTMRIVVLKEDKDKELKSGTEYFIDRIMALRMIEDGKATTPDLYKKIVKKKAEETAKSKKEAFKKKAETATSKKASVRSKAVKK